MRQHPLEPLSADEFRQTASILRREGLVRDTFRFASIELKEPPKGEVKAWSPGDAVRRTSFAVVFNREDNKTYEATVDLTGHSVVSFEHVPDVTPNFTLDEFHDVDVAMRQHPDVIAKLAARGFTDMSLILVDVWTYGKAVMPEQHRQRRLGWCDLWARETPDGNPFAHPISGLKLVIDMNTLELLEIEDHHDYGHPAVDGEYIPSVRGTQVRTDLKPLHITQPEGASFTVEGAELRWQNWTMRLGFNYREGPVIYQVTFDDRGTVRDIAYRMSFAEMIVPYRDPTFDHYRRTAYDIGEWGLGVMTKSLELGCDCLGEVTYLDATLCDSKGDPYDIPHAICLHEEDNAVLWKHVDPHTGAEIRRQRRMVVSCHASVANYEYLIYWRFYQDGNIECEVRATGLMVTTPYVRSRGLHARTTAFLIAQHRLPERGRSHATAWQPPAIPRRRSTPASASGSRTTHRSRTPTWSSGTSSASTTSLAWRSGRSCPSTWCRSGSSPRASSTRTPRWTRRPSERELTLHRDRV